MRTSALVFAAVAALSITAPARATTVITNYGISGPVDGTFTLSLDTNTSLFSLTALNLLIGTTPFDTTNAGLSQSGPNVTIGGNAGGVTILAPAQDDFRFTFQPGSSTGFGGIDSFFDVFFEISPSGGGIARLSVLPEPSTWAMLLLGFGAIGFAIRRRRRAAPTWSAPVFEQIA